MARWRIEEDEDVTAIVLYAIAKPGTIFAPNVVTDWRGRPVPVTLPSGPTLLGYVDSATVVDDGRAIQVRVKLPQREPERPEMGINGGRTPGDA